ncbi:MAG TPA: YbfB/YjiJ family MFS transporter [Pseudonocardia sp.]|uniref:YbfB/YjiJ family MFS transporter n=1 Tax=Pseudonocardia sp. TaxID=60912 RepID=UPI002B4B07A1|nr:YbfB/YjiJ family MFS transporter [Pseudonocardia sp.]HLU58051.1 YbfB/YjiJ family MFS transporter [Pseudonocardia sp.]
MTRALLLSLGTASALGFGRFAYGLLLPAMRDDLGWSLTEAGAMNTANGLGYLVGAMAAAAVVRALGTATAFRSGMALTALSLGATALTSDFALLLGIRAISGATGAVVFIAGGVIAARLAAAASSGTPLTIFFAGAGLGIAVSGAAIPGLGSDWRAGWVGLAAAAAVATAASWAAARTGGDPPVRSGGRAHVLPLWRVAVPYVLFATGYITYITFLSAHLAEHAAPAAQVALVWTAMGLAVIAAPALWSRPVVSWPGGTALAALLGILAAGAALALASAALPVVLASVVLYGATFMAVPAAVTARVRAAVPAQDWTATIAALTTLFAAGQTAGPWLAGVVADHTSTGATVTWTAVLCAAGAAIAVTERSRHPAPRR